MQGATFRVFFNIEMIKETQIQFFLVSTLVSLSGCEQSKSPFEETTQAPIYINEALVQGVYFSEDRPETRLTFGNSLTIHHESNFMSKRYRVEGSKIYVQMENSSLESRMDLELIIANQGKDLFCTACAKFGLANSWKRIQ
ncbi:hypothetical protein [Vibrio coralliilyticus]|uniref:Lipoprotein n=1 Tax=Vibrio coralliilyticus TaxID=190893 RepID=A0AAP6ZVA1_9VIBR|nr:hypothetical protein [Vibrio coralliilyticus]NOI31849.1 hypothetical protein [Vibrio coralliilyticus]NOJ25293.1 hypothetical protein [Vibrio coralliilyticus]